VIADHLIAVSSWGEALLLDRFTGTLKQRIPIGPTGKPLSAPTTDGARAFIGARDGLYVLDVQAGSADHWLTTERRIAAAPVSVDDVIYVVSHDHQLVALDRTSGRDLWRWSAAQRLELAPVLAADGRTVFVVDRAGLLSAVQRPLMAAELMVEGRWAEAAAAYRQAGQPLQQAEALSGQARQVEAAGQLEQAGDLWQQAEQLFMQVQQIDRAQTCCQNGLRCRQQPVLIVAARYRDLQPNVWSSLEFVVRNDGFGPAQRLIIHAVGDDFKGELMQTRQITTVPAGGRYAEQLDVFSLTAGRVPLHVRIEYADHTGMLHSLAQKVYIDVAPHATLQTIRVFTAAQLQPADTALDVELRILGRKESAYPVELTLGSGEVFRGEVFHGQLADGAEPAGRALFTALVTGDVLKGWGVAQARSSQRRLRLRIDLSELHATPWELLHDGRAPLAA
jgi:hypothetical protein